MRWENVDFDHNWITISDSITMTPDGKEHLKDPKTDLSARTISMPAWVMSELWEEYKVFLDRPSGFNESRNPTHRVCTNQIGKPYSCKTYSHITMLTNAYLGQQEIAMPAKTKNQRLTTQTLIFLVRYSSHRQISLAIV